MIVAVTLFLGFFALVFGLVYMQKKESLAMLEKNMNPREDRPAPYKNLKWGLLLVGAGVGLLLAYLLDETTVLGRHPEPLYIALIGIGGGAGLICSYKIEKKELLDKQMREERLPVA